MIKLIVFSVLLNTVEMQAVPPDDTQMFARKRTGKGYRGRGRGGRGLR